MVELAALVAVIVPVKAAADAAMTALAAIIALLEIVAEAIDVGLLVTLDQSTELAVFE
jgi:hypothetical protein